MSAAEAAELAVDEAVAELDRRGLDPDDYPQLLAALERGVEQAALAREAGRRDLADYMTFVRKVYAALDAPVVVDDVARRIEPPRRTLRRG